MCKYLSYIKLVKFYLYFTAVAWERNKGSSTPSVSSLVVDEVTIRVKPLAVASAKVVFCILTVL